MKFITDSARISGGPRCGFVEVNLAVDEGDVYEECDKNKLLECFDLEFIKKQLNLVDAE